MGVQHVRQAMEEVRRLKGVGAGHAEQPDVFLTDKSPYHLSPMVLAEPFDLQPRRLRWKGGDKLIGDDHQRIRCPEYSSYQIDLRQQGQSAGPRCAVLHGRLRWEIDEGQPVERQLPLPHRHNRRHERAEVGLETRGEAHRQMQR
jgi:hypothetical protein